MERLSLCDWPGRATSVLFMGGCNLACPTCHNHGLAWHPERFPVLPRREVLDLLTQRRLWLDGTTVTGGEPTIVPDLAALLADLAMVGLPVKLDTNGMRPDVVERLLKSRLVSVFAVDVKGPFKKYPELTGGAVSAADAQRNIEQIFRLAQDNPQAFYFRTTKVPLLDEVDLDTVRGMLPVGLTLVEQNFVAPGRNHHAETDSETRRLSGDMVSGSHRSGDPQSSESQRHQGSPALQTVGG